MLLSILLMWGLLTKTHISYPSYNMSKRRKLTGGEEITVELTALLGMGFAKCITSFVSKNTRY
jgi:hypothetical protein